MKYYFVVLGVGLYLFLGGLVCAQTEPGPPASIEVIVGGQRYESVHAYKLEQVKNILIEALSSENLQEFSEEELSDIIKEVYQQVVGVHSKGSSGSASAHPDHFQQNRQVVGNDALDLSTAQMREMLEKYQMEHKDAPLLLLDPKKVKSIIIEKKKQPKSISQD